MKTAFIIYFTYILTVAFTSKTGYSDFAEFGDSGYTVTIKVKKNTVSIKLKKGGEKICNVGKWDVNPKCILDAKTATMEALLDVLEQNSIKTTIG